MADVMPDYAYEQQKLIHQLAGLRLNLERDTLEIMELRGRIKRAETNVVATRSAISDLEIVLKGLRKEHGPVPEIVLHQDEVVSHG